MRLPLAEFFLTAVHSHGALSKEDLKEQAEKSGYFDEGEGGRITHATIMNLCRAGRMVEVKPGIYAHPSLAKEYQAHEAAE